MRVAVFQPNPTVGDFAANRAAFGRAFARARDARAGMMLAPAGALSGAPLEGLARRADFLGRLSTAREALRGMAAAAGFFPADPPKTANFSDNPVSAAADALWTARAARLPPRLCLAASARPYRWGHGAARAEALARFARARRLAWIEANLAGGQDETVFAGGSLALDAEGRAAARGRCCQEDFFVLEAAGDGAALRLIEGGSDSPSGASSTRPGEETGEIDRLREALVAGLRDYWDKNRIPGAVLGLSGGIDSALAAALAVEALGPARVRALTLPGPFTSEATLADALALAENLKIACARVNIEPVRRAAEETLLPLWRAAGDAGDIGDLPRQNLQARARAVILMGWANRLGWALLNTSNASEGAMGYGTLYGDLCGSFAPLREVSKTRVWELSRRVNAAAGREVIPVSTIERIPSAELAPGQEDRQSLPDYPVLDPMLEAYLAGDGLDALLGRGFPAADAKRMAALYSRAEFKRRQGIPGPRTAARGAGLGVGAGGAVWAAEDAPPGGPEVEAFILDAPPWDAGRRPMTGADPFDRVGACQ